MLQVFARVAVSIIQSVFISVVMFLIAYSVITQEFPPNFNKISEAWKGVRGLSAQSGFHHQDAQTFQGADVAETDVQHLEAMNEERRKISNNFFSNSNGSNAMDKTSIEVDMNKMKLEIQSLKNQIYDLEVKVDSLKKK